jgi:hypothetical protein
MMPEWIFQLLTLMGTVGAVYAAIKTDIVEARITAQNAAANAKDCHVRLDKHIEVKH